MVEAFEATVGVLCVVSIACVGVGFLATTVFAIYDEIRRRRRP